MRESGKRTLNKRSSSPKACNGCRYTILRVDTESNRRIGPEVVKFPVGTACEPIYGFSDKGPYDRFCSNSQLALTPYPLVKFYLREQARTPGDGLKLVVVDAAGPREPCLRAATMAAVLEAQENHTTSRGGGLPVDVRSGNQRLPAGGRFLRP